MGIRFDGDPTPADTTKVNSRRTKLQRLLAERKEALEKEIKAHYERIEFLEFIENFKKEDNKL